MLTVTGPPTKTSLILLLLKLQKHLILASRTVRINIVGILLEQTYSLLVKSLRLLEI